MSVLRQMKRNYRIFLIMVVISCLLLGVYLYRESTSLESNTHIVDSEIGDDVKMIDNELNHEIFDIEYQNVVEEKIQDETEKASLSEPFLIYNPFGTNNNAVNIYFHQTIDSLSYTIEVDGYDDYAQELNVDDQDGYQIIGLIAGETNYLTVNVNGQQLSYVLDMPASPSDVSNQLEVTDGTSQEELSDGLFTVLGKDTRSNIFLYDNSGVLRSELIVDDSEYRSDRVLTIDDHLVYTYDKTGFVFVNRQGKIDKILQLEGYYMHHDFIYDEDNNNLLILANQNDADTIEDMIVSLNLDTEKTTLLVDMRELLPEMYETATDEDGVNTYGGDELDWLHLNSLSLMDDDCLLVSSRELSTVIKLNNIYDKASIDYMIADESIYKDFEYQELLLDKVGDIISQAGQHSVIYSLGENLEEGCYYVSIFNNNYGRMSTRSDYDWSNIEGVGTYQEGTNSYMYKYLVNENEGTYTLVETVALPYSAIVSSIEYYDNHLQTSSGRDCSFGEYDQQRQLIRQFNYEAEDYAYRAFKYSYDIWFQ